MRDRSARSGRKGAIALFLFIACLLTVGIVWRRHTVPDVHTYRQSRVLLDTVVDVMISSTDEAQATDAMEAVYAEMQRIETLLSKYHEESQIFRLNQLAGQRALAVDQEVEAILRRALRYSQQTDGLFDISIGPLVDLWGIGTDHEKVPQPAEVARVLASIGYAQIEMNTAGEVLLRHPQNSLDLGGIAKGYSIDRGIDILKQHGITSALLNAGGDIRCIGNKRDGSAWRIGVKHPRDEGVLAIVELEEMAVATSGDYERYFLQDGRRYHHLLDPRSGQPAENCQSVTILAPSAEQADVMATAVFIMGPERGVEFIETQTDIEGMIVGADGEIVKSSGFSFQPK